MDRVVTDPSFDQAYRAADEQLRLRHAKVGCALAMTLMPAGSALDLIVYPEHAVTFLWARLATTLAVGVLLGVLFTSWGERRVRRLDSFWALLPAIAIAWMVYATEGETSPYYAGLNLVILAACLLMPYPLMQAAAFCSAVLGCYLLAVVAHEAAGEQWRTLGNNLYFIVLTGIIGVTSCHYHHRRRIEDFRLRHALDQRNRELAEMDRLKTDFVANISHELRTPLTLILAPVDRLLEDERNLPPKLASVLNTIRHNGLRLLRLIDDLLDAVRLDAPSADDRHDRRRIDLARYVRGVVDSVRGLAQAKRITMETEGDAHGLIVEADPVGLEKALLNLLTNAIKFTPDEGRITVTASASGEWVRVAVADTGVGIPSEHLGSIFDRFRQVDSSSTRQHQGVGLGLALVKEWLERDGGRIEVRSTPGAGTTFTVSLRRVDAPVDEAVLGAPDNDADGALGLLPRPVSGVDAIAEPRPGAAPTPAPEGSRRAGDAPRSRVLVVDDEPDMRALLLEMLGEEHEVTGAADGAAVLARAEERRPDAIVLDLMLPGVDGFEVCHRVRESTALADVGILVLTARGDERSKIRALQSGADDFLTKPFSSVEMRTRLSALLRTRQLQAELRSQNQELEGMVAALRSARLQLVHSEKMNALGMLAAGLLHEINNPLNYTLTALQLAQQEAQMKDLAEPVRETLDDIGEGMGRIRDIVSDLRSFAHPDDLLTRHRFALREAVDGALRLVEHLRGEAVIDTEVPEDLVAQGSKSHITQVLVNVISNALRAVQDVRDQRTPRVAIRAWVEDQAVVIRVSDNGVGVVEDKRRRVFDPFYTTREVGQGMGLGLSICHTIVAEHNGSIQLQSTEGSGTAVTVQLPL